MAARRLVIVMLVLLGISSVAAALVPVRETQQEGASTTTSTEPAPEAARGPLERTLRAEPGKQPRIRLRAGQQLALTVRSRRPDQVEIGGLGELADVDRFAPAVFDLLPFDPGSYPVRLLDAERVIGRIEVAAPATGKPKRRDHGRSENDPGRASGSPHRA